MKSKRMISVFLAVITCLSLTVNISAEDGAKLPDGSECRLSHEYVCGNEEDGQIRGLLCDLFGHTNGNSWNGHYYTNDYSICEGGYYTYYKTTECGRSCGTYWTDILDAVHTNMV